MFLKEEEKSGKGNNSGLWGTSHGCKRKDFFLFYQPSAYRIYQVFPMVFFGSSSCFLRIKWANLRRRSEEGRKQVGRKAL